MGQIKKALALTRPPENNEIPAYMVGSDYLSLVFRIEKQGKMKDQTPASSTFFFFSLKKTVIRSLTNKNVSGLNDNLSFLSSGKWVALRKGNTDNIGSL